LNLNINWWDKVELPKFWFLKRWGKLRLSNFFVSMFYLWQTYWSDLVFFFVRVYDGFVENEDGDVVVGRVLVLDLELIVNENLRDFALVILWRKYRITITQWSLNWKKNTLYFVLMTYLTNQSVFIIQFLLWFKIGKTFDYRAHQFCWSLIFQLRRSIFCKIRKQKLSQRERVSL
jgi:hypothetical protein